MSVDYATAKAALTDWVQTVCTGILAESASTGLPIVQWEDEANNIPRTPYAMLSLTAETSQGQDHVTWVHDSGTDTVSPRVRGNRQVTVQVSIRGRDGSPGNGPRNALSKLRASLHHPLILEALQTGGLAYVAVDSFINTLVTYEGRKESIAVMDVRFGAVSELFDPTFNVERIRNAGLTNEIVAGSIEELVGVDYPPPGES